MFYFIYKTTNLINHKYYVGKRQTKCLDDGYLGSGLAFKRAVRKYGKNNFKREILEFANDAASLSKLEQKYVTDELVQDPNCYNLVLGGKGGLMVLYPQHPKYKETIEKIKLTLTDKSGSNNPMYGKKHTTEARALMSKNHARLSGKDNPNYGKRKSEREKQNSSFSRSPKQFTFTHPEFGTHRCSCWDLANSFGLNIGSVRVLARGNWKAFKNWTILPTEEFESLKS